MKKLRDYQLAAVNRFRDCSSANFALEMRLGKTLVAIEWLQAKLSKDDAVLVVSPTSAFASWVDELADKGLWCRIVRGTGTRAQEEILKHHEAGVRWFVTSYRSLFIASGRKRGVQPSPIADSPWTGVVLDESTHIKNPQAQTTKAALGVLARATFKCCLSGIQVPETILDLVCPQIFLHGHFLGYRSYWELRSDLFQKIGYEWQPKKGVSQRLRRAWHARTFALTRKAAGFKERVVVRRVETQLSETAKKAYRRVEKEWALGEEWTQWSPVRHSWLCGLAGGRPQETKLHSDHKLEALKQLLTGKDSPELASEQVVVWFARNRELAAARHVLSEQKPATLWGRTTVEKRMRIVRDFAAKKYRVLLVQFAVAKFGMNLSTASINLVYSPIASHEGYVQAMQRVVKPGDSTLEIRLVARNTVDEDTYAALSGKRLQASEFQRQLVDNMRRRWEAHKHAERSKA